MEICDSIQIKLKIHPKGVPTFSITKFHCSPILKCELFLGNHTIVEWEDVQAKLIRPNLECTNGYIHIIDRVVMKRRDVTLVASAASTFQICLVTLLLSCLLTLTK